jgi:hypothetical protein
MTTAVALPEAPKLDAGALENVLIRADLGKLTEQQRMAYYRTVCESLGLNPLTNPFQYITLNGKLRLYATKDATEQLRKLHMVSVTQIEKLFHEGLYIVTAHVSDKSGRADASTGAVTITGLKGEALANALMKAETKAKRRATLSICGLGMLDETEAADITPRPSTVVVEAATTHTENGETVNQVTGEVVADDGRLRILSVTTLQTGSGRRYWSFQLSDERTVFCFREQEATVAEHLAQASVPIEIETKTTHPRNGGTPRLDLVELRRADRDEAAATDAPATQAEVIPF